MKHIIVHYDLIEKMILEAKEKDNQIFEQERDYRMLQERLKRTEEALDAERNQRHQL